jgi:16S rRNA (adenine1518-N6/adenine1519-N6)-dimethyltransferase
MYVRPKKYLGQHFLKDRNIAAKIVDSLSFHHGYEFILEVGPGMGILTELLFQKYPEKTLLIELDRESLDYLRDKYPEHDRNMIQGDFLRMELDHHFSGTLGLIGNFPYNISSQIFFKVFDNRERIQEVVGMVQREVALRIASGPGNKTYGILSVLLGAYYQIEYLFTVNPGVFHPVPRVKSAVIRLKRNQRRNLPVEDQVFVKIVKQSFQNRRKTLRNALKTLNLPVQMVRMPVFDRRAEQLTVEEFIELSSKIDALWKK